MAMIRCPLCGAELTRGSVCPTCGWDISGDAELFPTLFSAAGTASRGVRGERAERRAIYLKLGEALFSRLPLQTLRECAAAADPGEAARTLLQPPASRSPARKPPQPVSSDRAPAGRQTPVPQETGEIPTVDRDLLLAALGGKAPGWNRRGRITSLRFRDTLSGLPKDARDFSPGQDGSVMAWLCRESDGLTLTVCGPGGVRAPEKCGGLFASPSLRSLDFGGCFHTDRCKSMAGMFKNCAALEKLDLTGFDTGKVEDMSLMFYGCEGLRQLILGKGFRTDQVTDMRGMFGKCSALPELNAGGLQTGKVIDMSGMFQDCASLRSLNVAGFDTARVLHMEKMFSGCAALRTLDVSRFQTGHVIDMSEMFAGCVHLSGLDTRGFVITGSCRTWGMFTGVPGMAGRRPGAG